MANIRISDLTDLATPSGASVFPITHQGATRKITVDNLINYINNTSTAIDPTYATTGALNASGIALTNTINSLSGSLNSSGTRLTNTINSLSGLFTGFTGNLDTTFATDLQVANTGTSLTNTINSLSGSLNSSGTSLTNTINSLSGSLNSSGTRLTNTINSLSGSLNSSGTRLTNTINSLSGSSVLLYGNQTNISGIKTFVDNIGIGTASPAVELHVQNINEILRLETTAATGRNYLAFYKSGAIRQGYLGYGSTTNDFLTFSNDIAGAGMQFNVGGAFAMALDSGGNLGIGNSAIGRLYATQGTSPNSANLIIGYLNTSANYFDANNQIFRNGAGVESMRINSNGYFGIGTTTPSTPLVVGVETDSVNIGVLDTYPTIFGWNGTTNSAHKPLSIRATTAIQLFLSTGGNVGIATTEPSEKLQVVGNILANNLVYNTGNQNISGVKAFASRLTVNGTGVLLSGEAGQISSTLVQTTGNQDISGLKTFTNTGVFNSIQINNKLLTSYNYLTGGIFNFDNFYTTIVNSSLSTTGVLPSGITSGINYYVKNLNTGILTITGSGQRTIDGFTNINLYQNDSVNLLGMNNIGYTGWISTLANGGVS